MSNPNAPAAAPRTAEHIEAELADIDQAAKDLALADSDAAPTAPSTSVRAQDFEYEARRKGWKPEDQYTGPEGKWVDAQTFVERGERFTKKLQSEIESLKGKIESFEGTKAQFRKFFDDQMAKRDREYKEAIDNLRVQRSAASREGNDDLAVELEDRIEATRKQQAEAKREAESAADDRGTNPSAAADIPTDNPVLQAWIEEGNEWFKSDEILTKHAIAVGQQMRKDGEKATGRNFLEKVAEQVRSDFPRKFREMAANGGTRQVASGNTPSNASSTGSSKGTNGKTERDLPAADLALMRQFIADGLYTKETFLKSYFQRNG